MASQDESSTFAKGLKVIESFSGGRTGMSMAEVARQTGFDRATTRRLCLTLENAGYIVKTDRIYKLSPKVVAIAGDYLSSHQIGKSVQPVLNQFAEQLNGEINLAIRDGDRAIFIARSAVSAARLSLGFSVGSTLPLLPTAVGRMLLARCDQEIREYILANTTPYKYTPTTDVDLASLRKKIAQAGRDGYAHVIGEFEFGATGLTVPINNIGGREAVLGTTASSNQLNRDDTFDRALDALRSAAIALRD